MLLPSRLTLFVSMTTGSSLCLNLDKIQQYPTTHPFYNSTSTDADSFSDIPKLRYRIFESTGFHRKLSQHHFNLNLIAEGHQSWVHCRVHIIFLTKAEDSSPRPEQLSCLPMHINIILK